MVDRAINPTAANAAFEQAIDVTAGGAILVHFGGPDKNDVIHIPAVAFHEADKQIRASWLAPGVWPQTIAMMAEGILDLEPLVSQSRPAERGRPGDHGPEESRRQPDQGADRALMQCGARHLRREIALPARLFPAVAPQVRGFH